MLNTAVLTGAAVAVPVRVMAVEADGSVSDITNATTCRSTEDDVLKVVVPPGVSRSQLSRWAEARAGD